MQLGMGGILGDRIFKISFQNFVGHHLPTVIGIVIGIGVLAFLQFDRYFVQIFLAVWFLDLLPAMYLYLTYYSQNKGEEFEVRDNTLVKRISGTEIIYRNTDIEKIIIYLSPAMYKNSNFHMLAIEGYHFAIVKLKTGDELILTCLLAPRIDKSLKQLKGVLFEKRKKIFCNIPYR